MPYVFVDRDLSTQRGGGRFIRGTTGAYRWGNLRQATVFNEPFAAPLGDEIPGFFVDVHEAIGAMARSGVMSWCDSYVAYGDGGDFELDSAHLYDTLVDHGALLQYPTSGIGANANTPSNRPNIEAVLDQLSVYPTDPSPEPRSIDAILYPEVWNRVISLVRTMLIPTEEEADNRTSDTADALNRLWDTVSPAADTLAETAIRSQPQRARRGF